MWNQFEKCIQNNWQLAFGGVCLIILRLDILYSWAVKNTDKIRRNLIVVGYINVF